MTKEDNIKGSKLSRYMKAPLRILKKVRDMYVHGMIQCSHDLAYVDHVTMGCPTHLYSLPRSFSVNSTTSTTSNDDFKELVRAASLKIRDDNHVELGSEARKVARSRSVGIGRIEEDKVCEFEDNDDIKVKPLLCSQSRSCAIRKGARVYSCDDLKYYCNMTKKLNSRGSKFGSYVKAPLRLLGKVRDVYVRGMIQCSHDLASVDHTTMVMGSYPRSFNAATSTVSENDFKELVKAASFRVISGGNGVQLDTENAVRVPPRRSLILGMERNKEEEDDQAREFGDDRDDITVKPLLYTQSRSCTISTRSTMF